MPKCNCAGNACNCNITVGDGLIVSGTGNATAPFLISLSSTYLPIEVAVDGPVDISNAATGTVVDIALDADATALSLPDTPGARLDIIVRHNVSGTTVTWPIDIFWEGGVAPTPSLTGVDWYSLRRLSDNWIGSLLALDASL